MENNPSKLGLNSKQTTLNNQALDARSSPLTPSAEGSSRVQQVSAAQNPFPDGVQDLLSFTPEKRLQTIFVSTQPDDYFCGLVRNRQLDEKSRLAAAIKIKDNETRDAALAELAQDQSLEDELRIRAADKMMDIGKKLAVLTQLATDENLSKLCRLEAKVSTESNWVNTPNLMDASIESGKATGIDSEKNREMVFSAAPTQDKALDAPSNDSTEASLASVAIKGDVLQEAKDPKPQPLASDQNSKVATPSRVRVASIFLQGESQTTKAQGESPKPTRVDTSSPIRGAKSPASGKIQENVLQAAKNPEPQRLPSAQNNKTPASSPGRIVSVFLQGNSQNTQAQGESPKPTRVDTSSPIRGAKSFSPVKTKENVLQAAKNPEPQPLPSVQNNKTPASSPGRVVSVFLQRESQNTKAQGESPKPTRVDTSSPLQVAESLPKGETKEDVLQAAKNPEPQPLPSVQNNKAPASSPGRIVSVFLQGESQNTKAQEESPKHLKLDTPPPIPVAKSFSPEESQENALLALVQDKTVDAKVRLEAAKSFTPGPIRENVLLELTQDESLDEWYAEYRLDAANHIESGKIREDALLGLAQDRRLNAKYRVKAANQLESGKLQEDTFLQLSQDKTLYARYRVKAAAKLAPGLVREDALLALVQDESLDKWNARYRLDAANHLPVGEARENAFLTLAKGESLDEWYSRYCVEAAANLTPGPIRESTLLTLSQDKNLYDRHRVNAAVYLIPGPAREDALLALAKNEKLNGWQRAEAVKHLSPGKIKEDLLFEWSQSDGRSNFFRIKMAENLAPGSLRESALLKLAKDGKFCAEYRVRAAKNLNPGPAREDALLALAQDEDLYREHRLNAAKNLNPGPMREGILSALERYKTWDNYNALPRLVYID